MANDASASDTHHVTVIDGDFEIVSSPDDGAVPG
jgi:hypothetical protein